MKALVTLIPLSAFCGIATAFVLLYSACIGFLPLFGTPGYEMAFATGLVVPRAAVFETETGANVFTVASLPPPSPAPGAPAP